MAFRIGQKVVCVSEPVPEEFQGIKIGEVYTVREVETCPHLQILALRLQEIKCGETDLPGKIEGAFRATHFRPAVERKTDIGVFTEMLKPKQCELLGHD